MPWRVAALASLIACGSSPATPGIDGTGSGSADASAVCGMRGGQRGLTSREVTIDGLRRTYHVYLPASAQPSQPLPLVFVHHGFTMSGEQMHEITQYAALADAEGIAIAFPDGQGGPKSSGAPWNVGSGLCPSSFGPPPSAMGDDFALLDHMKADISADQCLDRDHIFVTGFSMGGYFSHHAGCMRSDIRAVAPHSGGTHSLDECLTTRKPIIIFHGSSDGLIPPGCSDPDAIAVPNVTPAADAWAQRNGCATTTTTRTVEGGTCQTYNNCPPDGQVELCTFPGMGHCWAGGAASAGIYSCPDAASATTLAWQFFQQYAW